MTIHHNCRSTFYAKEGLKIQKISVIKKKADTKQPHILSAVRHALRLPLCILTAVVFLSCTDVCADGVRDGLTLCARSVIPALFPFMVLSPLINSAVQSVHRTSHGSMAAYMTAFCLGMLTGFPIGALTVIDAFQTGALSKEHAERAMGICNGCGPAFLVGYAGRALCHSTAIGWRYVCMQLAASILCALMFGFHQKGTATARAEDISHTQHTPKEISLPYAIQEGVQKILAVCGFLVFFSVIRALLAKTAAVFTLPTVYSVVFGGILEITGGLADAAAYAAHAPQVQCSMALLSAFFIGFGGICVFMQTAVFARSAGLSMRWYILEKLICGILCAACSILWQ